MSLSLDNKIDICKHAIYKCEIDVEWYKPHSNHMYYSEKDRIDSLSKAKKELKWWKSKLSNLLTKRIVLSLGDTPYYMGDVVRGMLVSMVSPFLLQPFRVYGRAILEEGWII